MSGTAIRGQHLEEGFQSSILTVKAPIKVIRSINSIPEKLAEIKPLVMGARGPKLHVEGPCTTKTPHSTLITHSSLCLVRNLFPLIKIRKLRRFNEILGCFSTSPSIASL